MCNPKILITLCKLFLHASIGLNSLPSLLFLIFTTTLGGTHFCPHSVALVAPLERSRSRTQSASVRVRIQSRQYPQGIWLETHSPSLSFLPIVPLAANPPFRIHILSSNSFFSFQRKKMALITVQKLTFIYLFNNYLLRPDSVLGCTL